VSDAYGDAVEALKQKLAKQEQLAQAKALVQAFEVKYPHMQQVAKAVALAQSSPLKGKKNPDWDPLDHPKDNEGKFTEKHAGTFTKGVFKVAKFVDIAGKTHEVQLAPGEKLHKIPAGSHVIEHTDGSLSYAMAGTTTKPTNSALKEIQNPKLNTLVDENPKTPEVPSSHPDITMVLNHGAPTFQHPVSGVTEKLEPGQKLYQHKTSPNSFILANEDGQSGFFFNKHGQKLKSNPSTKVWTLKNYNQIWPPSKTSAAASAEAKKTLEQEAIDALKKQEAENKGKLDASDLAPWEKELLGIEVPAKTEETLDLTGGQYTPVEGDKIYTSASYPPLFVKVDKFGEVALWSGSKASFHIFSQSWWEKNSPKYKQIWGDKTEVKSSLTVSHGPSDGLWGAVPNPDGSGKIHLHPGDLVYAWDHGNGLSDVVVLAGDSGVGTYYLKNGKHTSVNSVDYYDQHSHWVKVESVPLEAPELQKGKSFSSELSTDELNQYVVQGVKLLGFDMNMTPGSYGTWYLESTPSSVMAGLASPVALKRVANMRATIDEFSDVAPSLKIKQTREALENLQHAQQLAALLQEGSTDDDLVERHYAIIRGFLAAPNVPYGFPANQSLAEHLDAAMASWRFERALSASLGFDLTTAQLSQKHQYMVAQGFTAAGALNDEQSTQWIKAHLNSPSVLNPAQTAETLESLATFEVLKSQAQMYLKKSLKTEEVPKPTPAEKAVTAQQKSFQADIKNLAAVYSDGKQALWNTSPDSWDLYDGSKVVDTLTTQAVMDKLHADSSWKPNSIGTIGGKKLFTGKLKAWEELHGTSLADADKKTLNTYIKQNGGNYVALMKASHKQDWIKFQLAGDEVAKWQLEWSLANHTYGVHKWENSHPGSWGTANGKAARQVTADFLASQPWFQKTPTLLEQLGKDSPEWDLAVQDLSVSDVKTAFMLLGLGTVYGADGSTAVKRREALAWWLESRGRLPKSSVSAPEVLQAPEKSELPVQPDLHTPPSGVQQSAWDLVLAAEAGLPEINKLKVPEKAAPIGLTPNLDIPPLVAHLAAWSAPAYGDVKTPALQQAKFEVLKAIQARAAQGVWAPPSYLVLEDASGAKHPLKPGSTVYQASIGKSFYVLGPGEESGFTISVSSKSSHVTPLSPDQFGDVKNLKKLLQAPGVLKYEDAVKDKVKATSFDWKSIEEIENKPASAVKFPGFSYEVQTPQELISIIKNHPAAPPYMKANADKLPPSVRLMAAWALTEKYTSVPDLIEWKLKNGHYVNLQAAQVLDPSANYYPMIMKGKFSPDDMWNLWDESWSSDLGKALDVVPTNNFWSKKDLESLHTALLGILTPEELSTGTSVSAGLPETLSLTKSSKSLGGMHTKQVWIDQAGNEWMSKAFKSDPNAKARVDAEHVAMTIGRLFGSHSPETRKMTLDNAYSYVQHLKPAKGDLSGISPQALSDEQLSQAMSEHVLDWLNSNHDSHPMNLLLDPNGKDIIPIDKGQAWRFFGEDKLEVGYLPPSNPVAVWYDQFYYAVQNGSVDKARLDKVTRRVLSYAHKVSSTRDQEVHDLLVEAFEHRENLPSGFGSKNALVKGVMSRKASLLDDFEAFYQDLYKAGGFKWEFNTEDFTKTQIDSHTHTQVSDQFVQDVSMAGVHGKALMFDTKDLEDAHLIVYTEKTASGTELAGQGVVRQDADKVLTAWLKSQLVENETDVSESSYSTDFEPSLNYEDLPNNATWYSNLVTAAKTVNHHVNDKEYNQSTLQNLKVVQDNMKSTLKELNDWEQKNPEKPFKNSLYEVVTAEQQAAWKALLERYIEDADRIFKAKEEGTKVEPHVAQVSYTPSDGLNTSGTPKKALTLVHTDGSIIDVWDDLNYILHAEGLTLKITPNAYKEKVEAGGWKVVAPDSKSSGSGDEVWTYKKGKTTVTWTKKPGSDHWVVKAGTSNATGKLTDDEMQKTIQDAPQLWSFEGPEVDQQAEVHVGSKTFKVYKRKSYASHGTFDYQTGELSVKGKLGGEYDTAGQTGYQYDIEYGNVLVQYRPWTEPGVAKSQQGLLRFKVKDWNGSTQQVEDVLDTLRTVGLNLDEATEESLQLFYWRHLYNILQDRADRNSSKWGKVSASLMAASKKNLSPADELAALKAAWSEAIGADKVEAADWAPKFSRFNPHVTKDNPEFTAGHPYWNRPDISIADVHEHWGSKLALSSVGDHYNMANIVLSGGMLATEERIRVLGQWITGMSSSADQNEGSGGFVFTRQNLSSAHGQVYYHPKVALRTSNYSFEGDHYGRLVDRPNYSKFSPEEMLTPDESNNELLIKHGLSFLDDIAVVVFPTSEERNKVIKRYKELGITEIHGLPIEDVLVTTSQKASQTIKKVWAQALKEAKE
jgi:uncharacterized protein YbcV (DUF1398 family)